MDDPQYSSCSSDDVSLQAAVYASVHDVVAPTAKRYNYYNRCYNMNKMHNITLLKDCYLSWFLGLPVTLSM